MRLRARAFLPTCASTKFGSLRPVAEGNADTKNCLAILSNLTGQIHILQQRRVAERAAQARPPGETNTVSSAEECCICSDVLTAPESTVTKCGHVYHLHCLLRCPGMTRNSSSIPCPMCRKPVHRAELVTLRNGLPALRDGQAVPQPRPNIAAMALDRQESGNSLEVINLVGVEAEDAIAEKGQKPQPVGNTQRNEQEADDTSAEDVDKALIKTLGLIDGVLMKALTEFQQKMQEVQKAFIRECKALKEKDERRAAMAETLRKQHLELESNLKKEMTRINRLKDVTKQKEEETERLMNALFEKATILDLREQEIEQRSQDFKMKELKQTEDLLSLRHREKRVQVLLNHQKRARSRDRQETPAEPSVSLRETTCRTPDDPEIPLQPNGLKCDFSLPTSPRMQGNELAESDDEGCIVEQAAREFALETAELKKSAEKDEESDRNRSSLDADTKVLVAQCLKRNRVNARGGPGPSQLFPVPVNSRAGASRVIGRAKGTGAPLVGKKGLRSLSSFVNRRATIQKPTGAIGKVAGFRHLKKP